MTRGKMTGSSRTWNVGARFVRRAAGVCLAGAAVLLALTPAFAAETSDSRRPPNILVILADDMGYSDLGCYGSEIATPNLDGLAAHGLRFTQFYNTARCWPTRSSLMTGYYAQQIRMDPPRGRLPEWAVTMPHDLKLRGYRCYHSGKWHISGAPNVLADGGFDHSYKLDDHNRFFAPQQHTEDDKPLPPVVPGSGYYSTTFFADHAIKCLREHAQKFGDRPFFSYLAFTCPHFPLQAPAEDIARYRDRYLVGWDVIRDERLQRQRAMGIVNCALSVRDPQTIPHWNLSEEELHKRIGPGEVGHAVAWSSLTPEQQRFQATKMAIHAAMIDRMDQEIGRVLEQIKAMGQSENTLVLFASDNGASAEQIIRGEGHNPAAPLGGSQSFLGVGPGWSTAANTPLRLHKSWVHEGGISTPLVVCWPQGIAARNELRHDPGHVVDILPTLWEVAGLKHADVPRPADAPAYPGRSLVPAFARDGAVVHDYIFFRHDDNRALRVGDWKLVTTRDHLDHWELYNLATDRCEMQDVAAQQPERVKTLAAQWTDLDALFRKQSGIDQLPPDKPKAKARAKAARKQ